MFIWRSCSVLWLVVTILSLLAINEANKFRGKNPEFQALVNKLWQLDENRFLFNEDLIVQRQVLIHRPPSDNATEPLFAYVNATKLYQTPTYREFIELMNYFNPDVLVNESSSADKTQKESAFLDAVIATPVMSEVHQYLVEKNLTTPDKSEFKELLGHLWFTIFKKKRYWSTTAFEHVFLGEGRGLKTLGFHYWLSLYLHEQDGSLNYYGAYEERRGNLKNVFAISFLWRENWLKEYSTFVFGSSPEFEMAVYTAAFMTMASQWPTGFRFAFSFKVGLSTRLDSSNSGVRPIFLEITATRAKFVGQIEDLLDSLQNLRLSAVSVIESEVVDDHFGQQAYDVVLTK